MIPGMDLIVVNYQTPVDLKRYLHSLSCFPPQVPWTLTIVNVCPTDEDRLAACESNVKIGFAHELNYFEFSENVGYARAVNRAATLGDLDTIAIFNADTKFINNVATECHNVLQSNPKWAIVGPRQIDSQGRITHGGFIPYERGFHGLDSADYHDVRPEATTVSGSAFFIKRRVWEELTSCPAYLPFGAEGAFLPTQHYYEETWCSYHARAHGYNVVYYGPSVMIHEWHKASPRGGHADQQLAKSKALFMEACEAHGI
jgi:GT2 family glycosyltransferase